jgi:hypothetical protein
MQPCEASPCLHSPTPEPSEPTPRSHISPMNGSPLPTKSSYNTFPGGYNKYELSSDHITTHTGPKYVKISTAPGSPPPDSYYASISHYKSYHVLLQSTCPPSTTPTNTTSFLQKLSTMSSNSLWHNLQIDSDGEWLLDAIVSGSLIASSDGSYMPDARQVYLRLLRRLHLTLHRIKDRNKRLLHRLIS